MQRTGYRWAALRIVLLCVSLALPGLTAVGATPTENCTDCALSATDGACLDFEALSVSTQYRVGDIFIDSGVVLTTEPFVWANGSLYRNGVARVHDGGAAGGSGLDLATDNINVAFDFGGPLTALSLRFGHYGGNINVSVNGNLRNRYEFSQLNGTTIGGVRLTVVGGPEQGTLQLRGPIKSFSIGGQELWIDDVCPSGSCVDWEDLSLGTGYHVGDGLVDSGTPVQAREFQWSNGTMTAGGLATIENGGKAGGSGLEMHLNNISLLLELGPPWVGLTMLYGHYGGNINLGINGEFVNTTNFLNLQGAEVGGAQVLVIQVPQSPMGRLVLTGNIRSLLIGGQELWIDEICPERCCAEFGNTPASTSFVVGEGLHEPCTNLEFTPFQHSGGGWADQGLAQIDTRELAGGDGQDLGLNNITAAFDVGAADGLRLHFGEYGGNVNLEINGTLVNIENLDEVSGQVIAGVIVSVINGHGNDKGVLTLKGPLRQFAIGGQELWIDSVCTLHVASTLFVPLARRN